MEGYLKMINCAHCGSKDLVEESAFLICTYCRSKFFRRATDGPPSETLIEIGSDIQKLLQKCREDPINRRRFANLVLDMDPENHEAKQYL